MRFPAPLAPGDRIAVTCPSAGVPAALRPRLDVALAHLRERGYAVVVGECVDGEGAVSAPARRRAAELQAMLTDPSVAAVVPPWGGELAVEVLAHLDLDAIAAAPPTWLVGFSDVSTVQLALTAVTATAGLHGQNLMDTPYRVPAPLASWLDVLEHAAGSTVSQRSSTHHRSGGFDDWTVDPGVTEMTLDAPGSWRLLDPGVGGRGRLRSPGRRVPGDPVGPGRHPRTATWPPSRASTAPEGLVLHLEAAEDGAFAVARALWSLRLAGWFEHANAVLVGRTSAPDAPGFTQEDAVRSALGDLGVPVVLDVDCGHVPPHLCLVQGARARVVVTDQVQRVDQVLG